MYAEPGDWLIVRRADLGHDARKAEILEVRSANGAPPYRVRWLEDGHLALVFPGPDSRIVPAADLTELDRAENARLNRMQRLLAAGPQVESQV